jgi:hypothetical protein
MASLFSCFTKKTKPVDVNGRNVPQINPLKKNLTEGDNNDKESIMSAS